MGLLTDAMAFAAAAHGEARRKGDGVPAILHAMEAAIAGLLAAEDPGVAVVTLGDKLSNLRSLYRCKEEKGAAMWDAFHQKDPAQHHWYYRTIAGALSPLARTAAWREYDWLIRQVFEEI